MRADGSGPVDRLTSADLTHYPNSWRPDGRQLLLLQVGPRGWDLWGLAIDETGAAGALAPVLEAAHDVSRGEISPDGRWIVYSSLESGNAQIWVSSFPELDRRWLVASGDAGFRNLYARWSRASAELFYWTGERMMVTAYETDALEFRSGVPEVLFEGTYADRGWPGWDVAPDGQRFVMFEPVEQDVDLIVPTGTVMVLRHTGSWLTNR